MNNKQEIKDVIEGKKSQCQNKLEEEFIEVAKQAIDSFPGEITEKQVNDIDTYFSPRLCPDQYVGKIQHDWRTFERKPVFSVFEEELKAINIPDSQNIIIMILESPHKYEYYRKDGKDKNGIKHKKGEPIGPAMGNTGIRLRKYFWEIFGESYENYHLVLMNAIPFQCSLGASPPGSIRDVVFAKAWKNEILGKTFFLERLDLLLSALRKKNVVIVNACTDDKITFRREKVTKTITELVGGIKIYGTAHPSSWMGHQYFEEI